MLIDKILYERIKKKKKELDELRPLPKEALSKLKHEMEIEWTYNSNAIEGNTLTLGETRLVLERGITIGGKSFREHLEAKNHMEAIKLIESFVKKKTKIDEFALHLIHDIILKAIGEGGQYRKKPVYITGASFLPPRASEILTLMKEFLKWLQENPKNLDILELSALAHHKFVKIHPYIDGNGRVARLLMNLILMRKGFPPTILLNTDRKKYHSRLKSADKGDAKPFVTFIARNVERSLNLYLHALKPEQKDTEFITLAKASKICSYSQEYLSLLARKGRLDATKLGRNWVTTRKALKEYLESVKKS